MAVRVSPSTLTLPEALGAPMQSLTKPRPAGRTCEYCQQPAVALTTPVKLGHPDRGRVGLDHQDCYEQLMQRLGRAAQSAAAR
jgi:hypothetical protein